MDLSDLKLDEFGDLVLGPGGEPVLVEGLDCLIQDLRHRLMTVRGSLPADPDYGLGLALYLHGEVTAATLRALKNDTLIELAKDTRLLPQRTDVRFAPSAGVEDAWDMTVHFKTKDGDESQFTVTVEGS